MGPKSIDALEFRLGLQFCDKHGTQLESYAEVLQAQDRARPSFRLAQQVTAPNTGLSGSGIGSSGGAPGLILAFLGSPCSAAAKRASCMSFCFHWMPRP